MAEFSGVLKEKEIEALLQPYLLPGITVPADLYHHLANYLQLLLKWNARTNLTAIRNPEEIVRRHFGESLFAAQHVGPCKTLLDFGSGAGFPGLPIQLMRSEIQVTLAESQNKKATFLREAIRTLDLRTVVWGARVEAMPPAMRFDAVTLRAVDRMDAAIAAGSSRCGRQMMLLTTANYAPAEPAGFAIETRIPLPNAMEQQLLSFIRQG